MARKTKPGRVTPEPARTTNAAAREAGQQAALRPGLKVKVRALHMGYYDDMRRREGDVFVYTIPPADAHGRLPAWPKWIERVDPRTPESVTTGPEELRKKHDAILKDRMPPSGTTTVSDGLAEGEKNPLGE